MKSIKQQKPQCEHWMVASHRHYLILVSSLTHPFDISSHPPDLSSHTFSSAAFVWNDRYQHNQSQKSNVSPLPQPSSGNYNLLMTHPPRHNTSSPTNFPWNGSQKSNVSPLPQYSSSNYNLTSHQPRYNTPYHRTLLLHHIDILYHRTLSTHPIDALYYAPDQLTLTPLCSKLSTSINVHSDTRSPSPDIDDASTTQFPSDNASTTGSTSARFFNTKQHPVNRHELEKSICEGSQHSRGSFSYNVRPLTHPLINTTSQYFLSTLFAIAII